MKKMIWMMLTLMVLSAASVNVVCAQVRIGGNTNPVSAAVLDLNADSTTTKNTKGLALPRVELTSTTSFAPLLKHVAGMLVYNTATANDVTPGTYYNTGSAWVRIGSGDGAVLDDMGAHAGDILKYDGTSWAPARQDTTIYWGQTCSACPGLAANTTTSNAIVFPSGCTANNTWLMMSNGSGDSGVSWVNSYRVYYHSFQALASSYSVSWKMACLIRR